MLARSTTSFGLVYDFTIRLLTIIRLVFMGARIDPTSGFSWPDFGRPEKLWSNPLARG
jgi:hypothetical protein